MGTLIQHSNELLRISPKDARKIEYSTTNGRSWSTRFSGGSMGKFLDLIETPKELLATTEKGLYYSTTHGRSWSKRG